MKYLRIHSSNLIQVMLSKGNVQTDKGFGLRQNPFLWLRAVLLKLEDAVIFPLSYQRYNVSRL